MSSKEAKLKIIVDAQDSTRGTFRSLDNQMQEYESRTLKTAAALGKLALAGGTALAGFLGYGIKIAGELQTAEIGLATLLGSADAARATVARLKIEAARTPFELPGLTQATQLLTSVTKDGDKSIDILLNIGEALAAMGKGQSELDRIIVNLQQVASVGKASMIDIKQFAFAGIPIFEMLSETTGKTGEALENLIADGGVTFELLTKMFDEANDSGGRFFNAFVNQSGSFQQTLANLKDAFGLFWADIAVSSGVFDGLTRAMQIAADLLLNYKERLNQAGEAFRAFLTLIDEKTGLVTLISDMWKNLVMVFNERLKPALIELWATLQPFKPFLEAFAQVIGVMLVVAIGATVLVLGTLAIALIEALTLATKVADFFYGAFASAWEWITDKIGDAIEVVEKFVNFLERAVNLVGGLPGKTGSAIGKLFNVNDAVIAPNGNIISTHPDDYLIATKDPSSLGGGGGITVNINGGTYLSEDVAESIGDMLMSRLKLSNQM